MPRVLEGAAAAAASPAAAANKYFLHSFAIWCLCWRNFGSLAVFFVVFFKRLSFVQGVSVALFVWSQRAHS